MSLARRWIVYWHGEGAAHQYDVYRCEGCGGLITWRMLRRGGCRCGRSPRMRPARLTWGERVRLNLLPWRFS